MSYTFRTSCAAGAIRTTLLTAVMLAAVALAPIAGAQVKGGASVVDELDVVLTLVSIDRNSRTAVLHGATDIPVNVTLPSEVQSFERAKPGDRFSLHYVVSESLTLHKGGAAGVSETQSFDFAVAGNTPIGRFTTTRTVTLRVQQVNRADRTITVPDANNRVTVLPVDENDEGFDSIAVGDTISIISTETIELEPVPPGVSADGRTFRNTARGT